MVLFRLLGSQKGYVWSTCVVTVWFAAGRLGVDTSALGSKAWTLVLYTIMASHPDAKAEVRKPCDCSSPVCSGRFSP